MAIIYLVETLDHLKSRQVIAKVIPNNLVTTPESAGYLGIPAEQPEIIAKNLIHARSGGYYSKWWLVVIDTQVAPHGDNFRTEYQYIESVVYDGYDGVETIPAWQKVWPR